MWNTNNQFSIRFWSNQPSNCNQVYNALWILVQQKRLYRSRGWNGGVNTHCESSTSPISLPLKNQAVSAAPTVFVDHKIHKWRHVMVSLAYRLTCFTVFWKLKNRWHWSIFIQNIKTSKINVRNIFGEELIAVMMQRNLYQRMFSRQVYELFWHGIFIHYNCQYEFSTVRPPRFELSTPLISSFKVGPSVERKSAIGLLEKSAVPVEISASAWHSFQKKSTHISSFCCTRLCMCLKKPSLFWLSVFNFFYIKLANIN